MSVDLGELQRCCEEVMGRMEVCCMGLVEFQDQSDEPKWLHPVRLIHRSAMEFLKTDEEALALLRSDESTDTERVFKLIEARFLSLYLSLAFDTGITSLEHKSSPLVGRLLRSLDRLCASSSSAITREQANSLAYLARSFLDSDRQGTCAFPSLKYARILLPCCDFFGIAARQGHPEFLQYGLCKNGVDLGRPPSVAYVSYLAVKAVEGVACSGSLSISKAEIFLRIVAHFGVDPNFPVPVSDIFGWHGGIFYTTIFQEVLEALATAGSDWFLEPEVTLAIKSLLCEELGSFLRSSLDLSRTVVLVVRDTDTICTTALVDRRMSLGSAWLGIPALYIESNVAFATELALRKFSREEGFDAAVLVSELIGILDSLPIPRSLTRVATWDGLEDIPWYETQDAGVLSKTMDCLKEDCIVKNGLIPKGTRKTWSALWIVDARTVGSEPLESRK